MNEGKRYLTDMVEGWERLAKLNGMDNAPGALERFVLDNGRAYEPAPLPAGVKRGVIKECFKNAYELATANGYRYVEGYALSEGCPLPVLHAWVVDGASNAIDPTWRSRAVWYYGVEFDLNYVLHTILAKKTYGVIDALEIGYPLLTGEHKYAGGGKVAGWEEKNA